MRAAHEGPRRTPSQRRSRELVTAILDAAARLVEKLPLEQISTGRLADVAGVSVGSLYQYFRDKESILTDMLERKLRADVTEVLEHVDQSEGRTLMGFVERLVDVVIEMHSRDRELYRRMLPLVHVFGRLPIVQTAIREARVEVVRAFERYDGELRDQDVALMEWIGGSAVIGVVHAATLERPELLDDPRFAAELKLMMTRYMAR